jgi:hypothetical protein
MSTAAPASHQASGTAVSWQWTGLCLTAVAAVLALFVRVGADCYWVVALGDYVIEQGHVPRGLPFAAAPTEDWPNVVVLAEVILSLIHRLGPLALPFTQLAVDVVTLYLVAVGARRLGASDRGSAIVVLAVALGSLSSLVIVRLQIFSLVPFALLLLLLRSEAIRPSRRIWALPLLVAVWTNLHGAVLLGVAVAGAYLLFSRLRIRPRETVAVGVATLVAVLATPVGWRTVAYYQGVLDNEAARRSEGLWAAPSLSNPFDVILGLAALLLLGFALRRRLPMWEYVVLLGLVVGTVMAARHGLWLLMAASAPAAVALSSRADRSESPLMELRLKDMAPLLLAVGLGGVVLMPRGDSVLPADPDVVEAVVSAAGDRVVLAPEPLAESLALGGGVVWVADPVDAFDHDDQVAYLDFIAGEGRAADAVAEVDLVVVEEGSDAADLVADLPGFRVSELPGDFELYSRK